MDKLFFALNAVINAANACREAGVTGYDLNDLANVAKNIGYRLGDEAAKVAREGDKNPFICPKYNMTQEEKSLALQNAKIAAIKLVRERTGMGLKEAKDLVEVFMYAKMNHDWLRQLDS